MSRSNIKIWVHRLFSSLGYGFIVGVGQWVLESGHFFLKNIYIFFNNDFFFKFFFNIISGDRMSLLIMFFYKFFFISLAATNDFFKFFSYHQRRPLCPANDSTLAATLVSLLMIDH